MDQKQEDRGYDRRDRFAVWIWLMGFGIMALLIAYDSMHALASR